MIEINGKNFYTASQAASQVGVSKSYICRLCRDGKLTAKHTDLGWLIPVQSFAFQWAQRRKK